MLSASLIIECTRIHRLQQCFFVQISPKTIILTFFQNGLKWTSQLHKESSSFALQTSENSLQAHSTREIY